MNPLKMAVKHAVARRAANVMRAAPRDLTSGPIRLYWWQDRVNFGDVLSPEIVKFLTGRPVEWASMDDCDMVSIGSIYGWLRINARRYRRDVHVWGSGIKKPSEAVGSLQHLHHHLVRGPLTTIAAEDNTLPTGDPGLLAGLAYGVSHEAGAKGIGIIPHRSAWDFEDRMAPMRAIKGARLIDFRSADCRACIEEIASCEVIYSSSLHGLVIADALKIPNFWIDGQLSFEGVAERHKYFDYGLSLGRDLHAPVSLQDHIAAGTQIHTRDFAYFDGIDAKVEEIAGSFPYHIFGGHRDDSRAAAM